MSRRRTSSAIGTERDRRPLIGLKQGRRGRRSWSFHNLTPQSALPATCLLRVGRATCGTRSAERLDAEAAANRTLWLRMSASLDTSLCKIAHFGSRVATVRPPNPCILTQRWFRNLPICEALSYADESAVRGKNRTSFDEETIGNLGRCCVARQRRCSFGAATDPEAVR
jgi:hypothetical protein